MEKKIGIIASDIGLKETIENLYKKDVQEGNIMIDILDYDKMDEQGKLLEKRGARAIIARSGGYRYTIGSVEVPVINLKITTLDILYSIKTASKIHKDIVLVLSDLENFDYNEWKDMIFSNVIIEKFISQHEIEGIVSKYASMQSDVVIVGGGIPCRIAQKYNLNFVHIGASDDSIHDAISRAWELVDNLYEQKYKNEVLNSTLDGVHDAVLAIDKEENIILYNKRAQELLKKDRFSVLNKKLLDVFSELSFVAEVLLDGTDKFNEIIHLKKLVIAANISLLKIDEHVVGVLCSFQDITKLQNMEKKIRYELNKKGLIAKYKFEDIIAVDPVMKETLANAVKIGMTDVTSIIYGESGTGKEMIAQSIHNFSDRREEPFVAVNCAALSESLLESELFGYEEGAFTGARKGGKPGLFELAHGGTIFLDEINSISLNLQSKLLRVLEEMEVMRIGSDYVIPLDLRILTAANQSLKNMIEDGSFRKDLFYRLNILELNVPPLRKRTKDIVPIFRFYIEKYSLSSEQIEIDEELQEKLINYTWPGNVRELRNIAQRYIIFDEVELEFKESSNTIEENSIMLNTGAVINLKEIDRFVEMKVIGMLEEQGMSKNDISKLLGISRTSLWNKKNTKK